MSLYNMIMGVSPATFFVLPLLGRHPDEYPRFKDCFISDDEHPQFDNHILIYTQMGGIYRSCWENKIDGWNCACNGCKMEKIKKSTHFVTDFDDSKDNTYATYVFRVPAVWKVDFYELKIGNIWGTSDQYKKLIYRIYPEHKADFKKMYKSKVTIQI